MGYLWRPPREVVESSNVKRFIDDLKLNDYGDFVRLSVREYKWFWGKLPEWLGVEWFREPREVYDVSKGPEWAEWYVGGLVNAAYNVVDRVVKLGLGHREAFTWVGEDGSVRRLTYLELRDLVNRAGSLLKELGVRRGEVVSIYAPMTPETVAIMLASMKIGAVASPIFSGFAAPAVAERIRLAESRVLVTLDGFYRRGRVVRLKDEADKAAELAGGIVEAIVVVRRLGIDVNMASDRDLDFDKEVGSKRPVLEPEEMDPNDPALLIFTSGTTGKPKGAVISHAGAILQPGKEHFFNLDIKPGWDGGSDRLWWVTDLGWMMGPWQVMGSQLLGSSHLMVEGAVDRPRDRVWSIIERFRVTHFGFAATTARILKKITAGEDLERFDLSSLRVFGNTGEPIDPDTWMWVMREVGGETRPIINLSGGTEVFGCLVLPSPIVPLKPSTLWGPGLGMDVDVFDDKGEPVRGRPGYLVVKKPAPSMTRGLWRDPKRYIEAYWSRFPGVWYHGDLALIDNEGFWFILGRADDVIKVAGKRIGPAEVEAAVNSHPAVVESACIGWPHELKGEVIACFAVLREGFEPSDRLRGEIASYVEKTLGKPFKPEIIEFVGELPRTRSGKIMRRLIKSLATGTPLAATEVLENPGSLDELRRVIARIKSGYSGG